MKREQKKKVIESSSRHPKDTGSPEVQVSIITERIKDLTAHLEKHPKDLHSKRGLLSLVGKRRKTLTYLKRNSRPTYEALTKKLDLRK